MRRVSAGQAAYALVMIGLGVAALLHGTFPAAWTPAVERVPAREVLAYGSAVVSLLCGVGLLVPRIALPAARAVFWWSLLWFLALRLPVVFIQPRDVGAWYEVCEMAVMVAGAWALYVRLAEGLSRGWDVFFAGEGGLRVARVLFALSLVLFGVGHFVYLNATAGLVPAYLPWHKGWAVFTGCAFFAASVAILSGAMARLAAALVAVQIGLFVLLVYVPMILRHAATPFQANEAIVSTALTAAAWVMAESYGGSPLVAVSRRDRAR